MIALILAAGLILDPRPPELVPPGQELAYAVWLESEARKAAELYAGKDCAGAELESRAGFPSEDLLARQHPETLLYVESLGVKGCGVADQQDLLVFRQADGWAAAPMLPGRTVASMTLQKNVAPAAAASVAAAAVRRGPCSPDDRAQSTMIYDTQVTRPAPLGQPWSERWFVRMCGADYRLDIDFTPTPSDGGVDFHVSAPRP
jgi:hypothetical protein